MKLMRVLIVAVLLALLLGGGAMVTRYWDQGEPGASENQASSAAGAGSELTGLGDEAEAGARHPSKAGPRSTVVRVEKAMEKSLRAEAIKEFGWEDVIEWKAGEPEELDGVQHRVGLVVYAAQTIFGVKNVQAKAYISEGRVKKWVFAKSGLDIK